MSRLFSAISILVFSIYVAACGSSATDRYCREEQVIEFEIRGSDGWNAEVMIEGRKQPAMTAYSYFGNFPSPEDFEFALLLKTRQPILIFSGDVPHLVFEGQIYEKCSN